MKYESFEQIYQKKLIDKSKVSQMIKPWTNLGYSMHFMQPRGIFEELANKARSDKKYGLNLYYFSSKKNAAETILNYELINQFKPHSLFIQNTERAIIKQAEANGDDKQVHFIPTHFSQSPRVFKDYLKIDTFVCMVSPMNKFGYMSLGLSNDYASTAIKNAKQIIVEVNKNVPFVIGQNNLLNINEVDAVVEYDSELEIVPEIEETEEEKIIAKTIADLIPDGATLQMGIGGLPNSICKALYSKKDLGIHTEVLTTGMIDLINRGVVTNKYKKINNGISVFTFAIGNKDMYEALHLNPVIQSFPVDYVNDEAIIAKNDNVISINSTIEIDLTGACNSEHLNGHQFSATGGQVDFVRGAYRSNGGKSFIALTSTTKNKKFSKIVPRLSGPTTTLRTDTHYVVTEYGCVNLKGLTSDQRAKALIQLAHPDFREYLTNEAKKLHLI